MSDGLNLDLDNVKGERLRFYIGGLGVLPP